MALLFFVCGRLCGQQGLCGVLFIAGEAFRLLFLFCGQIVIRPCVGLGREYGFADVRFFTRRKTLNGTGHKRGKAGEKQGKRPGKTRDE